MIRFFLGGGMLSSGGRFVDGTFQRVGCFKEGRFVAVYFEEGVLRQDVLY